MKMSPRAKRMDKRRKRGVTSPLMLTSLMDIFTVLVVFLLASASTAQLPSNKDIVLPSSSAVNQPEDTLVIQISNTEIIVQGRKIADVKQALADDSPMIPSLVEELKYRESLARRSATTEEETKKVTIMGDEKIPFELLKKVMASCTQTVYTELSFAVLMKPEDA